MKNSHSKEKHFLLDKDMNVIYPGDLCNVGCNDNNIYASFVKVIDDNSFDLVQTVYVAKICPTEIFVYLGKALCCIGPQPLENYRGCSDGHLFLNKKDLIHISSQRHIVSPKSLIKINK